MTDSNDLKLSKDTKDRVKKLSNIKQDILEKYGALQEDEFSELVFKDIETYVRREQRLHDAAMQIAQREEEQYRGVALAFGQIGACDIEASMRMHNGHVAYFVMRPAQVTEYIHQLAALVGLTISVKPREDFSSYRAWKEHDGYDSNYIGLETDEIGAIGYNYGASMLQAFSEQKADEKERKLAQMLSEKIDEAVREKVQQLMLDQKEDIEQKNGD